MGQDNSEMGAVNTDSPDALQWRHDECDGFSQLFAQLSVQVQIKENIKAPRQWPLCGEFTGDLWIPHTKGQ